MADDQTGEAQAPAEDGPLPSRLDSKSWKTRMEAYEELVKVFVSPIPVA
jgi:hypothetical protein